MRSVRRWMQSWGKFQTNVAFSLPQELRGIFLFRAVGEGISGSYITSFFLQNWTID